MFRPIFVGGLRAFTRLTQREFANMINHRLKILRKFAMPLRVAANLARGLGACVAVAISLALAGPASAVEFIGFTNGCFGNGCVPTADSSASTIVLDTTGLSYTNSTFDVNSSSGVASIGSSPGLPNVNNLGSFSITSASNLYTGEHFNLLVSFTDPTGVSPTSAVFTDLITGSVTLGTGGGIFITFSTAPQVFTFDGGQFTLFVNNVSLTAPAGEGVNSVPLSGTILVDAVPEASTWAMMLLGFFGVGFVAYRRKLTGSSFRFA
jgi:hypothetical protein